MKKNALLTFLALALAALALPNPKTGAFHTEASPAPEQVTTVPLFRLQNVGGQFLYTVDPNEMADLQGLANTEWLYQGTSCYVLAKKIPGAVEMYRLRKSGGTTEGATILNLYSRSFDYFFYTADKKEADNAVNNLGWRLEGVPFYVSPKQRADTIALNRYYRPIGEKIPESFFYTTDSSGYTTDSGSSDYNFEHIEAYVWKQTVVFDAATGLAPPKAGNAIKAPAGWSPPSAQQQLFTLGCVQDSSKKHITCPTIQGLELCEYYKKKGDVKASFFCTTTADQFTYGFLENDLTARGCLRFLGRAGEFLCETLQGAQACRDYMKKGDGLVTRCLSVKDAEMTQDLKKHGCYSFLGREGEYMCPTTDGFKTCENYRIDGRLKICRQPKTK